MGAVLDTLRAAGLNVQIADGDHLAVWPKSALTPELRQYIRAHKLEILDALTDDRRHCATCMNLDGKRCRVRRVMVIDDLQWGDSDSALLLGEVLRPPAAPPLMLLVTCRREEEARKRVRRHTVVPDILTMAKGLTSAYVQLGAVGLRPAAARAFQERAFPGGLTYNSHTLACATALATIAVYEEEGLLENAQRMGRILRERMVELEHKHPSVGASRSIGLFGIFELVRDRRSYEPMAPYNGASDEMAALDRFFREQGLYTFVRWNTFFTNAPLIVTEAQLDEGLRIIDRGLEITDRVVKVFASTAVSRYSTVNP